MTAHTGRPSRVDFERWGFATVRSPSEPAQLGAVDKAWEAVQASGEVFDSKARVDTARAILAKHIIAAAKDGERDEGRLRDGALVALAQSTVRSATRPPQ